MRIYFVVILLVFYCEIRRVRSSSIFHEKDVNTNQSAAGGALIADGDVNQSQENVPKVDCGDSSCLNGGLCVDEHCVCPSNYFGRWCEKKLTDPCLPNPCENSGKCVEYEDSYWCLCKDGYVGYKCETGFCDPNPCYNGGRCFSKGGQFYCDCAYDYTGVLCNETLVTHTDETKDKDLNIILQESPDPCASNPCKNDGNCVEYEDSYWCLCKDGYTGDNCEQIQYSTNTPFETTTEIGCSALDNRERSKFGACVCMQGYVENESGSCVECNCGYHKDSSPFECIMSPHVGVKCICPMAYVEKNRKCVECDCGGGKYPYSCLNKIDGTKECMCPSDFFQLNETCVRSCSSDYECQNGGACQRSEDREHKRCYCVGGYSGDRCEINQMCQSLQASCDKIGAECKVIDGKPNCVCPSKTAYDWEKSRCEDVCTFDTCLYGSCQALTSTFQCRCWSGYTGLRCDQKDETSVVREITSRSLILTIVVASVVAIILFLIVTIVVCAKMRKKS